MTAPNQSRKKFTKALAGAVILLAGADSSEASRTVAPAGAAPPTEALMHYRGYQLPAVHDHSTKTALLHWARQIGKSTTLAGWSVNRILRQLQTHDQWLITVLSNSRANGGEFVVKVHEVCRKLQQAFVEDGNREELDQRNDISEDAKLEMMRFEVRFEVGGKLGRIIVLAANPRTARGFSGDLILDEFAFHQDSRAIWEAGEPIISANPEFLCRIASTGNGRRNMFYQMISEGRIPYYRLKRSEVWATGEVRIYSVIDGREITPDEARAEASDKRAYDQNYECEFNDESSALLTQELISSAEREGIAIEQQEWSEATIERLRTRTIGDLYLGQDVGRQHDRSVIAVLEKIGQGYRVVAMLCMASMRLPAQQRQLDRICRLPGFRRGEIDMTGIGLGLVEYAQEKHGDARIGGVNFATTEPITRRLQTEGRKAETARVTEIMATELLGVFEDRRIEIPCDPELRDALRKPERLVSPSGRVSIAAERDEAGHADHFWALALAIRASRGSLDGAFTAETLREVRWGSARPGMPLIARPSLMRSAGQQS